MTGRIEVLGVPLYSRDIPSAVNHILESLTDGTITTPRCISETGAHGIVHARENPEFKALLNSFYINLPDGMPGVWVGRLKGARYMKRCYGPNFFAAVLKATANKSIRHYFCGGKDGVAESLREAVFTKFGNANVVGTHSPPFRDLTDSEYEELGHDIDNSGADMVWIGISTPKQERFAYHLAQHVSAKYIITVGAAFDFHTGSLRQAPKWMQQSGLEWSYRLMVEPRRLYRRYLHIVPVFMLYSLRELTLSGMGAFIRVK